MGLASIYRFGFFFSVYYKDTMSHYFGGKRTMVSSENEIHVCTDTTAGERFDSISICFSTPVSDY